MRLIDADAQKGEAMDDLISRLSEIRSQYNCFNESEEPYYRALSEVIKMLLEQADGDTISRQAAIDAVVKYATWLWERFHETCNVVGVTDALREVPSAQPEQQWIDAIREVIKCSGSDGFIIVPKDGTEGWGENGVHYTIQPEQRWIPCSERLPVEGESVLLCDRCGDMTLGRLVRTDEGYKWDIYAWWNDIDDWNAWIPLPEPYAERRTDG